jgi:formate dehydrogenase major subunit
VAGLAASFGSGAMTNDIAGIKNADVILIIGSDTSAAHPVIANRIKQAVRFGKTKLIVIDPKEIEMAKFAAIYARQRCGTDVAVLNGIMREIIKNDWHDQEYIAQRCEGFEQLQAAVEDYTPEKVEQISGIPAQQLREIAELFGTAETASVFYAMGITQHTTGVDNVRSVANLQMLCGNLGKDGGGVNPLRGQVNVQGACDMGGLPNVFSGYQSVADKNADAKFAQAWGRPLSNKVGLTVTEMLSGAEKGTIKALYVMGENPMLSDPDITHVQHALEKVEFLVVQDIFLTETAQLAHVVLPATSYAEKDGLFTNTERRAQRIRKALNPPGQAKEDWVIIQEIANAMGSDWKYQSAYDINEEIRQLTPSYGGITWERVGHTGLQWPCPTLEHPGTPYLHKGTFARGKGLMVGIAFKEPAELPDAEYPLILTTGRVLQQFHTGTMTRKTDGLNNLAGPMVMISVEDAGALGIKNGEPIKVASRRGEIQAPAFVTKQIGKGAVYIPFHYHEAAANILTNPVVDPIAKIPEYKACAVRVSKVSMIDN